MFDTAIPLAGGLLIAIIFQEDLLAIGEWIGRRAAELIILLIFGRTP